MLAIATAYGYSRTVVFGLAGKVFFWALAASTVIVAINARLLRLKK